MRISTYKVIFLVFFIIPLAIFGSLSAWEIYNLYLNRQLMRHHIQELPAISNPVEFILAFNSEGKNQADLAWQCKPWVLACEGNYYLPSPLPPYRDLKTTSITLEICRFQYEKGRKINISQEGRKVHVDPYWNVLWIEIDHCGEQAKFFGPYRLEN